jgi:hypothetical protein
VYSYPKNGQFTLKKTVFSLYNTNNFGIYFYCALISCTSMLKIVLRVSKKLKLFKIMKKVNLKGKLGLRKETMSKLDMNSVNGGATAFCPTGSLLVICGLNSLACPTFKCQSLVCPTLQPACTIQTLLGCPTTGPGGSLVC